MQSLSLLDELWAQSCDYLKARNNYREIFFANSKNNSACINFSSNDYLSLRQDLRICNAGYNASLRNGAGTGAARSVLQTDAGLEELENYFCANTGFTQSLFLQSGFVANMVFFDTLSPFVHEKLTQQCFVDQRCHASIFYALKASNLAFTIFKHNDMAHLEKKLQHSQAQFKIIVIESLFSMDGDFAPNVKLTQLCNRYGAMLFIDESHSFAIFGPKGSGWINQYPDLKAYVLAISIGCGKAVGVSGAFLATNSKILRQRVLQKAKLFIYSTGISPFISGAVHAALQIIFSAEGEQRREKLFNNIKYLHDKIKEFNLPTLQEKSAYTQIFPFIFIQNCNTLKVAAYLLQDNIIAKAIRPPSVPKDTSRIRICLNAKHSYADIDKFVFSLHKAKTLLV